MPDGCYVLLDWEIHGMLVWHRGQLLQKLPEEPTSIAIRDGNLYVNGYEYIEGNWKKTFKAKRICR